MIVLIFENSVPIINRLIDLIEESNKGLQFYNCISYPHSHRLLKEVKPDIVLMDVNQPGNHCLGLIKKIKAANEKTVVIGMFSLHDEQYLDECKKTGADYLVDKYLEFEKIPVIISAVRNNYPHHSDQ
jgi:DNA-binding NarL/FixJ family response regulator